MKKIILSLVALLAMAGNAMAENIMTLGNATAAQGAVAEITISMTSEEPIASFSLTMGLPEGVTFSDYKLTDRSEGYVGINANNVEGGCKIGALGGGTPIEGLEGEVLKVYLAVGEDVEPGDYAVTLSDVILVPETFQGIECPDVSAVLTVTKAEEIRYTDNQLYAKDITIKKGEDATMLVAYNSTSDIYDYAVTVELPEGVTATAVEFEPVVADVTGYTNTWEAVGSTLTLSGEKGSGKRDKKVEAGNNIFAIVTLSTSALEAGNYEIVLKDQYLSNDDDDFEPADYVVNLVVELGITDGISLGTTDAANRRYNLAGQRVSNSYNGIVVQEGRKVLQK